MQRVFSNGYITRNLLGMVFILAILLAMSGNTRAATWTVSAGGSIQDAITDSSAGDTIIIEAGTYDETPIIVDKDLTMEGSGASSTIVHGRFGILSASVTIRDLTVSGNNADSGGGILNAGTLTLADCTVSGNTASGSTGGIGGGMYNDNAGTLILTNCTVSGNTASGGISGGGGICNAGTATLTNCTVSGNTVSAYSFAAFGGGIFSTGTLTLTNCTVSENTVSGHGYAIAYGGGICNGTAEAVLKNTIVANNIAEVEESPYIYGPDIYGSVTATYCLIGDDTDATINGGDNLPPGDPMLEPLALNDNPYGTWTHALQDGSPAINAGTGEGVPEKDQRGFDRVGVVDIGSYEYGATASIVIEITAPMDPVQVDTVINVSATFTDPDASDTHQASWNWGDGTTSAGTITGNSVTGSHSYTAVGVYAITLTVTDDGRDSGTGTYQPVVVYDPADGFVTGGGWIVSPLGAYAPDPTLAGIARFGFVSKYKKGADTPTGYTHFTFRVADMSFHSDSYEWLVVAGPKAMYKGVGTINKAGNYGFMLTAVDADLTPSTDVDLFRIKIWDKDNGDAIVYDNQMGAEDDAEPATAIGGGNIKICTANAAPPHSRFADKGAALPSVPMRFRLLANYPNPFNPETWLPYELAEDRSVTIRIYNASGRLVRLLDLGHKPAGFYTSREKAAYWDGRNESGESVSSGIYFYQIQAGEFSATRKMTILR